MESHSIKRCILALTICLFIVLISMSLMMYSYGGDELYSITFVNSSAAFATEMILQDVHPPLYPVILKSWVCIFGDSEVSTRILSGIFSLASLMIFSYYSLNMGKSTAEKLIPIVVFGLSWPLIYFGNEVRPYSLLIMLSTFVFFKIFNEQYDKSVVVGLILISLSHYFGFAVAFQASFFMVVYVYLKYKKIDKASIVVMLVIFIWPILHFGIGTVGGKTGGEFWITSYPFKSFTELFRLFFSFHVPSKNVFGIIVFVSLLAISRKLWIDKEKKIFYWMAMIIIFLISITIIDLHTPVTKTRYLVCLLPIASYVITISILKIIGYRLPYLILVFLILFISTCYKISKKIDPEPDYKRFSNEINKMEEIDDLYFYFDGFSVDFAQWRKKTVEYYLKRPVKFFADCDDGNSYYLILLSDSSYPKGTSCEFTDIVAKYPEIKLTLAKAKNTNN